MPPAKTDPLTPEEIDALEPIVLGPTWKKGEDGQYILPEHTLGWQILKWCATYLNNFDGSPNLKLTNEQARFILWWYAVDLEGNFIYRRGVLQRLKGHGKDPLLAIIATVEFVGPCRLAYWQDGKPVAEPHPNAWVQIAAVNKSQTRNTVSLFPTIMSKKLIDKYRIVMGAELIRAQGGKKRLEAVTSSYRALEGGRATFVMLNEIQHWVQGNHGHDMYETIDGNITKIAKSRWLAVTNAFLPGEDSIGERIRRNYDEILAGKAFDFGLLYDSIEAHPKTPLTPEALRIVLPKIRGDSTWLEVESVVSSVLQGTITRARSRRMFLNQIVADEDSLISMEMWESIENPVANLSAGDEIVLGFDGGRTDDSTALVAIRIKDRTAFLLALEEKPGGSLGEDWEVDRRIINSAVHDAFRLYKVRAFYADVKEWETEVDDWAEDYREQLTIKATDKHAVGWDMRISVKKNTMAHERLLQAIHSAAVFHDGDADLRRHALNAYRVTNNYGVSFAKQSRESTRKVDAYAALMLAHEALHDYRTRGSQKKERTGLAVFI